MFWMAVGCSIFAAGVLLAAVGPRDIGRACCVLNVQPNSSRFPERPNVSSKGFRDQLDIEDEL